MLEPEKNIFRQTESLMHHDCEHQLALTKAEKLINNKNRQILTLNRIIKNLREEVEELQEFKKDHSIHLQQLKLQVTSLKKALSNSQLSHIKEKQMYYEDFVLAAKQIKAKYRETNSSPRQSRHALTEASRSPRQSLDILEKKLHPQKEGISQMTMGQMFMGKKMRLERPKIISYGSNWGRFNEISDLKYQIKTQKQHYPFKKNFVKASMNIDNAIEELRRQNQQLRTRIF